jgi:hypothetical protein
MYPWSRLLRRRTKSKETKPRTESLELKRERMAGAAISRQGNWRQRTSSISESDRTLAKIYQVYQKIDQDPPLGLCSSGLSILKRHLNYLNTTYNV